MKRVVSTIAASVLAVLVYAVVGAALAQADFGLKGFDVTFTNADGSPATQAGSHPFEMRTSLDLNTKIDPKLGEIPDGEIKNASFEQILGLAGNPKATPRCSAADFVTSIPGLRESSCPDSTAVGAVSVRFQNASTVFVEPVFNLEPPPGVPAKLGFVALLVPVTFEVGIKDSEPYNINAQLTNVPQPEPFYGAVLRLWGNPADPVHDPYRGRCVEGQGGTVPYPELPSRGVCPTNVAAQPFLTLPRSCQGPLASTYKIESWQNPGVFDAGGELTHDNSVPPSPAGFTGCSKLGFSPHITARPTTSSAESASGLAFSLDVQDEGLTSSTGLAQSDIRKAVVTFPEGVTVNPSAAGGLDVCTKANLESERLNSAPGEGCPEASKLGTVQVETPLLENEVLEGSLFQAQQDDSATSTPGAENPFDSLLALYVVIKSEKLGVIVKLPIKVEPDARTGQLIGTSDNLPQIPFSHFKLRFREGPRSPLITPSRCGEYQTKAELTPWSGGQTITTTSTFKVTSGVIGSSCPSGGAPPFHPGFEAGSISNSAGSYSPFNMRITRSDGEQDLTRFSAVLPPGVVGKLAGVAKCSDGAIASARSKGGRQELAAPSCPANSQVGRVLGGAGVGSALTYVPGKLYLAGPFSGNPLSVVSIVPAVAGPFDVGTIVTRVPLTLNPNTAEVEVDGAHSDPIPHILAGIPLKVRDLRVYADRPDFTLNATSCDPSSTRATLFGSYLDVFNSADDVSFSSASRYQAASCASLRFKPKLTLALKGGTRRGDHPALKSVVTYPRGGGYANIGKAVVTLPPSEFIDNAHIQNPCTRVQFNANQCPKGSLLGTARATTPLLDEPLEGPVYFRSNGGERLLPDVVADLHGLFRVILVGHVDAVNARVRTTFEKVPDAPVSKFTLNLKGGRKGLLVNNRSLCAHKVRATVALTAQNGKAQETRPIVKTSCKKNKKAKRADHRPAAGHR